MGEGSWEKVRGRRSAREGLWDKVCQRRSIEEGMRDSVHQKRGMSMEEDQSERGLWPEKWL